VSDKLVALGGLAQLWAQNNQDEYFAGLWKSDIILHLLWRAKSPTDDYAERGYTAPSWSWAAVDGPIDNYHNIKWGEHDGHEEVWPLVRFLSVEVVTECSNPYGRVKGGSLVLAGSLCPVEHIVSHNRETFEYNAKFTISGLNISLKVSIYWDTTSAAFERTQGIVGEERCLSLYFLPLMEEDPDISETVPGDTHCISGLLLKASGNLRGEFQRLGYFSAGLEYEHGERIWEGCRYFTTVAEGLGLQATEETTERGEAKYRITLI